MGMPLVRQRHTNVRAANWHATANMLIGLTRLRASMCVHAAAPASDLTANPPAADYLSDMDYCADPSLRESVCGAVVPLFAGKCMFCALKPLDGAGAESRRHPREGSGVVSLDTQSMSMLSGPLRPSEKAAALLELSIMVVAYISEPGTDKHERRTLTSSWLCHLGLAPSRQGMFRRQLCHRDER